MTGSGFSLVVHFTLGRVLAAGARYARFRGVARGLVTDRSSDKDLLEGPSPCSQVRHPPCLRRPIRNCITTQALQVVTGDIG